MVTYLVLLLVLGVPPAQYDTVVLTNGGVLRGTVVEDLPGANLLLEMPDGAIRTIPRGEIAQIDYARTGAPAYPEPYPPPPPEEAPPGGQGDTGPAEGVPALDTVPVLQGGIAMGVAFPVGLLDASGLGLASTVSPQLTFTFEGSYRPMAELELGLYLLLGGGSAFGPLNGHCLDAGGACQALDLSLGFFPQLRLHRLAGGRGGRRRPALRPEPRRLLRAGHALGPVHVALRERAATVRRPPAGDARVDRLRLPRQLRALVPVRVGTSGRP